MLYELQIAKPAIGRFELHSGPHRFSAVELGHDGPVKEVLDADKKCHVFKVEDVFYILKGRLARTLITRLKTYCSTKMPRRN